MCKLGCLFDINFYDDNEYAEYVGNDRNEARKKHPLECLFDKKAPPSFLINTFSTSNNIS